VISALRRNQNSLIILKVDEQKGGFLEIVTCVTVFDFTIINPGKCWSIRLNVSRISQYCHKTGQNVTFLYYSIDSLLISKMMENVFLANIDE